jgi:hypothetical protein
MINECITAKFVQIDNIVHKPFENDCKSTTLFKVFENRLARIQQPFVVISGTLCGFNPAVLYAFK